MEDSNKRLATDLIRILGLPEHTDPGRILKRCRFNSKGYLSRLYLNGLNLKGNIDLSEFTKHLTALDSRNNPDLIEIRISSLSELGFLLGFDSEYFYSDALKTDKGQTILVMEAGHDSDESPFAKYFNGDETSPDAASPSNDGISSDMTGSAGRRSSDISCDAVDSDRRALAAANEIEKNLLCNAIIGREITAALQHNLDRTNIGMFNKGLLQLQNLAGQLERIRSIKQLIETVRLRLKDTSEETIKKACCETADSIWAKPRNGVVLADYLVRSMDDLKVNSKNFGPDGVVTLKYAGQKGPELFAKIRNVVRDEYITGAVYGESNLRLSIRKYSQLAEELKESIEKQ
ncbi:MAG: hypothetical protein K6E62_07595 [Lachnospiraceae bacterium]|nr:hypothetical protein [Lachnospiraceae bacterium]